MLLCLKGNTATLLGPRRTFYDRKGFLRLTFNSRVEVGSADFM